MIKLEGKNIYLAALERENCARLWKDYEYDGEAMTEIMNIGNSVEKADEWFEDIQKKQGKVHIRLGIFLTDGTVIGDVALQDIDWKNRSCTVGLGIARLSNRSKGYGSEAVSLLVEYGFNNIGLERISAQTLEQNIGAQKSLTKCEFIKEGIEREAVYFAGKRWDRLNYAILRDEYSKK